VVRTRPLIEVPSRELRGLLAEETAHWGGELNWDYGEVSSAVASGLERRTLSGMAVQDGQRTVAYCYYLLDGERAIVGSLFAVGSHRGRGLEESLLEAVLAEAQGDSGYDRVECQTLFSTAPAADERFARAGFASRRRHYLVRTLEGPQAAAASRSFRLRPLRREDLPAAAHVIYRSHVGSLDAALNMTYATPATCRAFVDTLVLRAGCGRYDPDASFLAEGRDGVAGVLLASQLSATNGHVCQVSILPELQGQGVGMLLMEATLEALRRQGLSTASLSVTVDNHRAYGLYTRLGFRLRKAFAAHAWARPPARVALPA
jgi:ribosomal protein S18 acetylase RimI-like enzyme